MNSLEKIENDYEKQNGFGTLIYSIKGTHLLAENFSALLNAFDTIDIDEVKISAFYDLNSIIGEIPLLEEDFTKILNILDQFSGKDKIIAFCYIISSIKISNLQGAQKITKYSLIETKFPTILNTLDKMDNDKRVAFCNLIFSIKRTYLLEENFSAILDTIDRIVDDFHKRTSLSYVISAIKGKKLFREKVILIKERFPQYAGELEELLKKEESFKLL